MTVFQVDDLLDDRSFSPKHVADRSQRDHLDHTRLADQVAELAMQSPGKVNIAVYGPWGAGKSSLGALIDESLGAHKKRERVALATFDAWQFAGDSFPVNFLSEIARATGVSAHRKIEKSLFQTRKTLNLPLGMSSLPVWGRAIVLVAILSLVFFVLPLIWTLRSQNWVWTWSEPELVALLDNVRDWLAYGVGGSLLLAVAALALELTRASIEESEPSHTTQFRRLFDDLLKQSGLRKIIVFVDELDRCSPEQLMQTLEGLRTFLGHERVVFVAAFDRDAVATTIVARRKLDMQAGESDVPYYLTAGEYLDKIFQFQLSLPPQSSHTMRRFALEIVSDRQGVWGELREAGLLQSVVSLLSPVHVRSPRRAKVLLNDFAVNARGFEQLSDRSWTHRAAEIAVWTVIQTEFPHLAADMTLEPDLPRYLIDKEEEPSRDAFRQMVYRYRTQHDALDVTTQDVASRVGKRQHADLLVYLERVRSLRVPFPASDLIWQTESPAFDAFEDQGLVDVLVRVPDRTVHASIRDLRSASPADVGLALEFLGRTSEEEFVVEARVIANVMGELADEFPQVAADHDGLLTSTWRRVMDGNVEPCTEAAARGFARAIARTEPLDQVERFAKAVHSGVEAPDGFLTALVESIPATVWAESASTIAAVLPRDIAHGFDGLESVLRREDRENSGLLTKELKADVVKALAIPDPPVVERAAGTVQARQAAAEALERHELEVSEIRSTISERLSQLATLWTDLSGHGRSRRWLLSLMRTLEAEVPAAADIHDTLIARSAEDQTVSDNAHLVIDAFAERPDAAARWNVTGESEVASELLQEALNALLLETIGPGGSVVADRIEALSLAFAKVGVAPDSVVSISSLSAGDPGEAQSYVVALRAIARCFHTEEARHLQTSLVGEIASRADLDSAEKVELAKLLDSSDALSAAESVRRAIPALDEHAAQASASFLLAFAAELKTRDVRLPLPISVVRLAARHPSWSDTLKDWLTTGPRFESLRSVVDVETLCSLGADVWRSYSHAAGEKSAEAAWSFLRSTGASLSVLESLASGGIGSEAYQIVGREISLGESDFERSTAVAEFLAMPQSIRASASVAADVIVALSLPPGSARSGDFRYVADLAIANASRFTAKERTEVRLALARFHPPVLRHVRRNLDLRAAGL